MSIKVADLTSDELITYIQRIADAFENLDRIVGDTPVSEQISLALNHTAHKGHSHEECVSREEYDALKRSVDMLIRLVGDTSVSEQISAAINK